MNPRMEWEDPDPDTSDEYDHGWCPPKEREEVDEVAEERMARTISVLEAEEELVRACLNSAGEGRIRRLAWEVWYRSGCPPMTGVLS